MIKSMNMISHFFLRKTLFVFLILVILNAEGCVQDSSQYSYDLENIYKLYLSGDIEESLRQYKNVIKNAPFEINAYLNAGILERILGNYSQSAKYFEKCLELMNDENNKDYIFLKYLLANTYYNLNSYDGAVKEYNEILKKNPEFIYAYFDLGRIYYENKDFDKAIECFSKIIEINPRFSVAYFYLGKIHHNQNRINEAIEMYKKTLKSDFNFCEIYLPLAELLEREKKYQESYKYYSKHSNLDPNNFYVNRKKRELKKYLAKVYKKISPFKIPRKKKIHYPNFRENIPKIRIGLGVNRKGKILKRQEVYFRCSGDFFIKSRNSAKIILKGKKNNLCLIRHYEKYLKLFDLTNNKTFVVKEPILIRLQKPLNNSILLYRMAYGIGFPWEKYEDREYRGDIEINFNKSGLILVNIVNIEEYLYGVIPSEMDTDWPIESLKAQAVAARSESFFKMKTKRHRKYGFHLCDDQHCEVYRGLSIEDEKGRSAVDETRGEVLTFNDKIADAVYSSNCGGCILSSAEVGWGNVDYLKTRIDGETNLFPCSPLDMEKWIRNNQDVFCNLHPTTHRWIRIIQRKDLERRIKWAKLGTILAIIPQKRAYGGHIKRIKIKGVNKSLILTKENIIRRIFALGNLKSTLFTVEMKFGEDALPKYFVFYGGGWGHSVGMCQTGAAGMASKGYKYQEILSHYYPGTFIRILGY